MDTVFIVAKESVIDAAGNETQGLRDWKNSVGTGAWILTDWVKGSSVSFSKNPNYWGYDPFHPENRLPYIDRITTFIIPDASTSLAAFRTGKIDTRNVTLMDAPSLMQINPDIKHIEMYANYSLELHMRTELEPFSDQKVRQALSIAINRDVIIKDLFQGHGNYLNRFFNPNDIALYVPFEKLPANLQGLFTYNPDKARQMLKEAGYPNGFTTSVLVSATDTTSLDAITLIKADWEKIGVKLNIDSRESAVTTSIRYGRTFEGLTIWGYGNAYAWTCPDVFASGHYSNISGVKDTWWDTARARVVGLSDATARNALGTEMNFYSLEKMWVIPLPTPNSYEMWWPWVKQWEGSFMSGTYHYFRPFRQAWLDQSLKNKLQP